MFSNNGCFQPYSIAILSILLTIGINPIARGNNVNPLEASLDPLLPSNSVDRPLSAFEIGRIEREIIDIDRQAEAQLAAENIDEAFALWYRELRLQRALGNLKEVAALGRIGNLAWQQNRGFDLRAIAQRLGKIQTTATVENKLTLPLLNQLGTAYRQVRYFDRAIDIYKQILASARQTNSLTAKRVNLEILGELYLDLFDNAKAAEVYEELLTLAKMDNQSSQLSEDEVVYLNRLATIYDRDGKPKKALAVKSRLAERYRQVQNTQELAALYIAMARDYQSINSSKKAISYYQQAYNLAFNSQQLALATEALAELARLYQQQGQINQAIATYKQQIKLQQQTYDYYGWMETCDRLGKMYWDLKNYSQAKTFYQQGLKIARSLNYRVGYFTEQIEQIERW